MEIINNQLRVGAGVVVMMMMVLMLMEGGGSWFCHGCLEDERIALLHIKNAFNPYPNSNSFLSYWGGDADCCNWPGVNCSMTSGRVTSIHLEGARERNLAGKWYLNASLFLPFEELVNLSLRENYLASFVENEELDGLSNLELLDLSRNKINKFISWTGLNKLKTIRLNGINHYFGSLRFLGQFPHLTILDLSKNDFRGTMLHPETGLHNLTNLEKLMLDYSTLDKDSLTMFGALPSSLKFISLVKGKIYGTLPSKGRHNLTNLEELYLDGSSMYENFLQSIGPLPSLKVFSWRNGTIFKKGIPPLKEWDNLDLQVYALPNAILEFIGTLSSLKSLTFSNCAELNDTLPYGLCKLKHLQELDMSYNNLNGHLPGCFSNLTSLERLDMSFNNFHGGLPSFSNLTSLQSLNLSFNNFTGNIPVEFGYLSKLQILNLSHNALTGKIPLTFSNLKEIESLDLSCNKLSGNIPSQLSELNFLSVFIVAYNNLSGKTPEMVAQFATFDRSSYEGNPFLCGLPLLKSCATTILTSPFVVAHITILLAFAAVLWIYKSILTNLVLLR